MVLMSFFCWAHLPQVVFLAFLAVSYSYLFSASSKFPMLLANVLNSQQKSQFATKFLKVGWILAGVGMIWWMSVGSSLMYYLLGGCIGVIGHAMLMDVPIEASFTELPGQVA
jgi:hypothetical protein